MTVEEFEACVNPLDTRGATSRTSILSVTAAERSKSMRSRSNANRCFTLRPRRSLGTGLVGFPFRLQLLDKRPQPRDHGEPFAIW